MIFTDAKAQETGFVDNSPVEVESDFLYQDEVRQILYGKGRVILKQKQQKVIADEIIYHLNDDVVYAKGNVAFQKEDGSTIFADEAKFIKAASQGVIINFKARFGKQALLVAKGAEMLGKNNMHLHDFAYTACKICKDNLFSYVPIWEIHSAKAEIDRESERVDYYNSTINIFGMPVFYTPYFNAPAPGAKRKTGFLMRPIYKRNNILGNTFSIPFYLNIAPNIDATYYPTFTSNVGVLHQGEGRYLYKQGRAKINAGISDSVIKADGKKKRESAGYYDFSANYRFDGSSIPGFIEVDSKRLRNKEKTFLKKFSISDEDILKTDVRYSNFANNYYYSLRALYFQDLRPTYSAKTTSAALPVFDGHADKRISDNIKLYGDVNMLNLSRPQGTNYDRISLKPGINSRYFLPHGNLVSFDLSVRGDVYQIRKSQVNVTSVNAASLSLANQGRVGNEVRVYPELVTKWNWPLLNKMYENSIIIEPVVELIAAPRMTNLRKLSNEDSLDPEITAGNLFSTNRYNGYDKIESGPRTNYGFRGIISGKYVKNINFVFGQNRRIYKDRNFTRVSGMDGYYSDYVGKVSMQINKYLTLIDNFRLDKRSGELIKNLVTLDLNYNRFNADVTFSDTNKRLINSDRLIYNKEYIANAGYRFYHEWSMTWNIHGRFGKKPPTEKTPFIRQGVMLQYAGDCLTLGFGISRDYTKLKDLKPSTTPMISIDIPAF